MRFMARPRRARPGTGPKLASEPGPMPWRWLASCAESEGLCVLPGGPAPCRPYEVWGFTRVGVPWISDHKRALRFYFSMACAPGVIQ